VDKRDERGRFAKGNKGGPGRPRRQTEVEYLRVTMSACTPEAWREIVARAVEDAKGGDAKARAFLAKYLLGEPQGKAPTATDVVAMDAMGWDALRGRIEELVQERMADVLLMELNPHVDSAQVEQLVEEALARVEGKGG